MITKKVLIIPQFSMNSGKKMFPSRDGNCEILKIFIKYFASIKNINWDIHLMFPPLYMVDDSSEREFNQMIDVDALKKFKNISITVFPNNTSPNLSPITNRYYFDNTVPDRLKDHQYDLIINNIPEISRNIVAFYPSGYRAKLISCHWFPDYFFQNDLTGSWENGMKFSYSFRQLDGILSSDANIFICESTLNGWKESIDKTFNPETAKQIHSKSNLVSLCVTDLDEYNQIAKDILTKNPNITKFKETTAIFPARITESRYTNWKTAFEMFLDPKITGRIIFCNPSGEKGLKCIEKHFSDQTFEYVAEAFPIKGIKVRQYAQGRILICEEPLTKQQYYELALRSNIVINLYLSEYYGGIAIREMIAVGKLIPFIPYVYEFKKWFRSKFRFKITEHMIRTKDELKDIPKLIQNYNTLIKKYSDYQMEKHVYPTFKECEDYHRDIPKFQKLISDLKII